MIQPNNNKDHDSQKNNIGKGDALVQPENLPFDVDNCIAPWESKPLMSILLDENCEAITFPKLFPTGKIGFKGQSNFHQNCYQKRLSDANSQYS